MPASRPARRFPFTLALIDIDDLGDQRQARSSGRRPCAGVRRAVTGGLRSLERPGGTLYGGEEFAILLEQTGVSLARPRLSGPIDSVARRYEYEHEGKRRVSRSPSALGRPSSWGDAGEDVTRRADEAFVLAKLKRQRRLEVSTKTLLKRLLS